MNTNQTTANPQGSKTITTVHKEVGYSNNVDIIETALREQFGLDDQSHVLRAVAAHIWSAICANYGDERKWGTEEIILALIQCEKRIKNMHAQLACTRPGCAISYPHYRHSVEG